MKDLLDQLSKLSPQDPKAKALQDEGNQVLQESGSSFLDKAEKFAPKVLDFVQAVYPPASPVIGIAKRLVAMVRGNPPS